MEFSGLLWESTGHVTSKVDTQVKVNGIYMYFKFWIDYLPFYAYLMRNYHWTQALSHPS